MKKRYIFFSLIILFLFITVYIGFLKFNFATWQTRGLFGDSFGALNALFVVFAFCGLIYTILLQRTELSLQREELKLQREEMAASREQLKAQVEAQNKLCKVLIGLIKVASMQALIEKTKMASESKISSARGNFQNEIIEYSREISKIAKDLENNNP